MKKFGIIPNLFSPGISDSECMEMTNGLELSRSITITGQQKKRDD
jgi:hypothetical protein